MQPSHTIKIVPTIRSTKNNTVYVADALQDENNEYSYEIGADEENACYEVAITNLVAVSKHGYRSNLICEDTEQHNFIHGVDIGNTVLVPSFIVNIQQEKGNIFYNATIKGSNEQNNNNENDVKGLDSNSNVLKSCSVHDKIKRKRVKFKQKHYNINVTNECHKNVSDNINSSTIISESSSNNNAITTATTTSNISSSNVDSTRAYEKYTKNMLLEGQLNNDYDLIALAKDMLKPENAYTERQISVLNNNNIKIDKNKQKYDQNIQKYFNNANSNLNNNLDNNKINDIDYIDENMKSVIKDTSNKMLNSSTHYHRRNVDKLIDTSSTSTSVQSNTTNDVKANNISLKLKNKFKVKRKFKVKV